jgi:hypothetical protein
VGDISPATFFASSGPAFLKINSAGKGKEKTIMNPRMSEIAKTLGVASFCALLLTLALGSGSACNGPPLIPGTPGGVPQAKTVQFFNCNHDNAGTGLPAQAYNVYSRVDNGAWVGRGGLNPQPGDWTDCHDAPHQGSSLTLDLFTTQQGKWEFRLIKLRREGEPDCDSSAPDVPNACGYLNNYFFQTVGEAPQTTIDVTE